MNFKSFIALFLLGLIAHVTCQTDTSEAYFNGSSVVVLNATIDFKNKVQFSFRTCNGGQLLADTGLNNDTFEITLDEAMGELLIQWIVSGVYGSTSVGSDLNNNVWTSVQLSTEISSLGKHIQILVNAGSYTDSYVSGPDSELVGIDLTGGSLLSIGNGFDGCIEEGSQVEFSDVVYSENVAWGTCPLESQPGCDDINHCYSEPCQHNGECIDNTGGYQCRCTTRYSGAECQIDNGNLCNSDDPQYGLDCGDGVCHERDSGNYTVCVCPPGYSGVGCNQTADYCASDPCKNEATCENNQFYDGYYCHCVDGFTGSNCETNIDECSSYPCLNGGRCLDSINNFTCDCINTGYEGPVCNLPINECSPVSPCMNGATCLDMNGGFTCLCVDGFTGDLCEEEEDECRSDPCANQGTCVDDLNGFTCACFPGFQGLYCTVEVDECAGVICNDTYICIDLINDYQCVCPDGTSETNNICIDIDECVSSPCENDAVCINGDNYYQCRCTEGYQGTNCEQDINECQSSPCLNNAICEDLIAMYNCTCMPGYDGVNCEIDVDECESSPCQNEGDCQDLINAFNCSCIDGYEGELCEVDIDECLSAPCEYEATCIDNVNYYTCICSPGFEGITCGQEVDECVSDPCQNNGTCEDEINGFTCICTPEWMGSICDEPYDPCIDLMPCENGGTCDSNPPASNYNCNCVAGFDGTNCENNIDDCVGVTCTNGTICYDLVNSYECKCPIGFEGSQCTVEINECASNPCVNGSCTDHVGFFNCTCEPGFDGLTCSNNIDECNSSPCMNGGICKDGINKFECFCSHGITGTRCEVDLDECLSIPCLNGATCQQSVDPGTVICSCAPGYKGSFCETDINECESSPCVNGATCNDNINAYNCSCVPGYVGVNCEIEFDECESTPCANNGICIDLVNSFECNCNNTGFEGVTCEVNINECESSPCQHGSTCNDLINRYNCSCHVGYDGLNCEVDFPDCAPSPCQNNATCYERSDQSLYGGSGPFDGNFSYDNAAGFYCDCVPGFVGDLCETNFDECASSACQNGATCFDSVNEFLCVCAPGYEGVFCSQEIDECQSSPCLAGSTCMDRVAAYQCVCLEGYGGINCDIRLTGCDGNTQCQNDAICIPYYNTTTSTQEFTCKCLDGFIGEFCGTSTAASFGDGSYLVDTNVAGQTTLNYTLQFATTLPSGLLLYSENGRGYLLVEMFDGQLFVKYAGDGEQPLELNNINSDLNDGSFHTFSLAITTTAIDVTVASTPVTDSTPIPSGYNHLVFGTLYIGGVDPSMEATVAERSQSDPAYVGCMQDVSNNDMGLVLPPGVSARRKRRQTSSTIEAGCDRVDQCLANTCSGQGQCTDLWWTFSCDCDPTWTGPTCNYSLIPATFSNEDTTSYAEFIQTGNITTFTSLELSFRTRRSSGLLFYSSLDSNFIAVELVDGKVTVTSSFSNQIQSTDVYNDANYHYVNVLRDSTSLSLEIDSTRFINTSASIDDNLLLFTTHYIGGMAARPASGVNGEFFKGCIVDVRYDDIHLEFYPVNIKNFTLNSIPMSSNSLQVLEGCVSDDTCKSAPCANNGTCKITWNDYECTCIKGFTGKNCTEETACALGACPDGTTCNDLDDGGIECVAVRTFDINSSIMYINNITNVELMSMSLQLRIRNQYALLLHSNNAGDFFTLKISLGKVVFKYSISGSVGTLESSSVVNDGYWHDVSVVISNAKLNIIIDNIEDTLVDTSLTSFNPVITNPGSSAVYLGDVSFANPEFFDNNLGFDGCLDEVRIGGLLLPFLTPDLYNSISPEQFTISSVVSVVDGCQGRDVCNSNPCLNSATCQDIWNDYTCQCTAGFDAVHCSNNINECNSNPCINGSCADGVNSYSCQCFAGFQGDHCQVDIDECASNPCFNGATCQDLVNDFSCMCTTNYTGKTCSELILDLVTCNDQTCLNGGTCKNVTNPQPNEALIECDCALGYEGERCSSEINYCVSNPCQNGFCNSNTATQSYTCSCFTGYEGVNCETDINECASNPCPDLGTCTDELNGYTCTCVAGYTGAHCEQNIDECSSYPCVQGSCSDNVNSFTCTCNEGYTGSTCQQDIDECSDSPCQNGASCDNIPGNYTCICVSGFFGRHCEVDPCINSPCSHGGTCTAVSAVDFQCTCPMGYQGNICGEVTCDSVACRNGAPCSVDYMTATWYCNCSQFISGKLCDWEGPCVLSPCLNGGTCSHPPGDQPVNYTCTCLTGYEGDNCEVEIDWCESTVCENDGTCSSSPPGPLCTCVDGWKGNLCEVPFACTSSPCQNSGECSETDIGYSCTCAAGYSGDTCQVNIDECSSSPCKNGAVCMDRVDSYECLCATGWNGTHCKMDIDECTTSAPCQNNGNCTNTNGSYTCKCAAVFVGINCQYDNPCLSSLCENGGTCEPSDGTGAEPPTYRCLCDPKYEGSSCQTLVGEEDNKWIIVGAALGGVAVLIIVIILIIFLLSVKSKRRSQGTYSPSRQEMTGSRVEMDNILKLPPEERLI